LNEEVIQFDVLIVGAGPAGAACVLALKDSGLKIGWIDKSNFPRDKVCGDAIPSTVQKVFASIDEKLKQHFLNNFIQKKTIEGCRLVSPDHSYFDLTFVNKGHSATRFEFDNYLVELACATNPSVYPFFGNALSDIQYEGKNVMASLENKKSLSAKIIIGCDGAHSIVQKKLAGRFIGKAENIAAVRAYYSNISGLEHNMLEIHFIKKFMPGYFWIFPLNNKLSNVGFGMVTKYISKNKTDLKRALEQIIVENPSIAKRFANAETNGKTEGFGLPCGGTKRKISGNNFLLCGDAASLINPATGEGIGNAMISGRLAGAHILNCFEADCFDASFNSRYDKLVYNKLLSDLKIQKMLQSITADRGWLVNFALKQVSKHEFIRERVRKFF
jgi:geranylgeranyl reductase family protein